MVLFPGRDEGRRWSQDLQQRPAHHRENGNYEGETKMVRYLDGGACGVWFGYCVVHIRRAGYLTVGRCTSVTPRGRRIGYYNDRRRPSNYIRLDVRYFIVGDGFLGTRWSHFDHAGRFATGVGAYVGVGPFVVGLLVASTLALAGVVLLVAIVIVDEEARREENPG